MLPVFFLKVRVAKPDKLKNLCRPVLILYFVQPLQQ